MVPVAMGIKALLSGARLAMSVAKSVDSSAALQARFNASAADVERDAGQVSFAVCGALVAHAIGRDPADEEVGTIMAAAVGDTAFPNRAYRLLGELRKSASSRRRRFLAATLFGLPFAKLPDDDRDRVDMVVERALPADVDLLNSIFEKHQNAHAPSSEDDRDSFFASANVVAIVSDTQVRLATTDEIVDGQISDVCEGEQYRVDHGAFFALQSLGCLDLGIKRPLELLIGGWSTQSLAITPLGHLVLQAVREVRPGFDGASDLSEPCDYPGTPAPSPR